MRGEVQPGCGDVHSCRGGQLRAQLSLSLYELLIPATPAASKRCQLDISTPIVVTIISACSAALSAETLRQAVVAGWPSSHGGFE